MSALALDRHPNDAFAVGARSSGVGVSLPVFAYAFKESSEAGEAGGRCGGTP